MPGLRHRAQAGEIAFGTIDGFLLWRLSGRKRHATDVTNASRTMLFDIRRLAWDAQLPSPSASRTRCCPKCWNGRRLGHGDTGIARRRDPDHRDGRRPTGGNDRPGLLPAGHGQIDLVEAMASGAGIAISALRIDGGMAMSDWTMQFLADIPPATVERPASVETTAGVRPMSPA